MIKSARMEAKGEEPVRFYIKEYSIEVEVPESVYRKAVEFLGFKITRKKEEDSEGVSKKDR